MAMARGHSSLGQLSPCLNKTLQIPPQQDSPIPSLPHEQTPRQPTPGLGGTQWAEELFCKPSQTKQPPIPGPSPSSQPPEDVTTLEPEPEVAPMQSTEEPFEIPASAPENPNASSPWCKAPLIYHDDTRQEFTNL
ncbi:hypothetical protein O181_073764 [Austropuccinia psidii MF-1]|uniref:Uncharacterized protein n=1 Tax=Austropuccinia psidii MF-1 TaxID=1389203 RepID=A0A9Q3F7T1_9BASI|nr:hypothetical protein [Austropuccinia psidii MF-1]